MATAQPPTEASTGEGWVDLCALSDLPAEGGHYVELGHRALAVIRVANEDRGADAEVIRVMDDHCPHAGGSLSAGTVMEGCIVCPWHAWPFDIETGLCPDADAYRVKVYPVKVENGRVWVRM